MSQQTAIRSRARQLQCLLPLLPFLAGCVGGFTVLPSALKQSTVEFKEVDPQPDDHSTDDEAGLAQQGVTTHSPAPLRNEMSNNSNRQQPAGSREHEAGGEGGRPSANLANNLSVQAGKPTRPPTVRSARSAGKASLGAGSLIRRVAWDEPEEESVESSEETLPAPPTEPSVERRRIPIREPSIAEQVQLARKNDRISLTVRDAPLGSVLGLIAEQHGLNIVSSDQADQRISVTLSDVRLEDALDTILSVNGFVWTRQRDIIIVSKVSADTKGSPSVQGRSVRVYPLNYVSAMDIDKIVKGLLSPVGQSFIVQASATDQRRTCEQLVVEDLPEYLERVDAYIAETDRRPRQVMVEAHVLQVTLKDDTTHGVDFNQLLKVAGSSVNIGTAGFANAAATPAGLLTVSGGDLHSVLECLKATTDAKTLASPKVAVLNGQEAHIQIGGRLGYLLTTTVQTTSMQSVNFLDFGVILKVTPIITAENKVLLNVKPQVSSARLNPANNLPESETTELETKVMLVSGEAVVIGGLIKEVDNDVQNKIPFLGDMWLVGRMFQRRVQARERDEIIITLLPTIVPDEDDCLREDFDEVDQAHTPLMYGPLNRIDRTQWEPKLPDASQPPRVKKWIKSGIRYFPESFGQAMQTDEFIAEPPPGTPLPPQHLLPESIPPGRNEFEAPLPDEALESAGSGARRLPGQTETMELESQMNWNSGAKWRDAQSLPGAKVPLQNLNGSRNMNGISYSPSRQHVNERRTFHAP